MMNRFRTSRRAFSVWDLIMTTCGIGVLVALLLPAVTAAREAARRASCQNHLAQIILAVKNYEMSHLAFPPGTQNPTGPIVNQPTGMHINWITQILPFIEQKNTWEQTDCSHSVYHPTNAQVAALELSLFRCGSSVHYDERQSNYAGVHHDWEEPIDNDNNGVFFLNRSIKVVEIPDGLSNTIFIGEKYIEEDELGWMSGTRASLRNMGTSLNANRAYPGSQSSDGPNYGLITSDGTPDIRPAPTPYGSPTYVGGFGSWHPGGAQFGFGDGSVRFLSETIESTTYAALGNRDGGELSAEY